MLYSSTSKLKKVANAENIEEFRKFHNFVFNYHLFQPGQRTLDIISAEALLSIELYKRFPICKKFIEFLRSGKNECINKDQWSLMLDVFTIMAKGDSYDPNSSCNEK